jgi:Spy/CpxP family protein refolding chaperone
MTRRFAVLPAILLALSAAPALAQGPPPPAGAQQLQGPGAFAQRRMQALLQGITLTAAQQARIDSIQARTATQMPAFTPGAPPDPAARQQRRELMQRQDSTIRAVLTPEQQALWDRNLEQMRGSMPPRPGN